LALKHFPQQELAKHAQTFVEEQLNMLESEMSAQEKAVTDKVTQHLQQQYAPPRNKWFDCNKWFHFFLIFLLAGSSKSSKSSPSSTQPM
jgi:hypothetical protein